MSMNTCETHKNVIPKNFCPVCLTKALQIMMKAWVQVGSRSMHQLKTDMDTAYKVATKALKSVKDDNETRRQV